MKHLILIAAAALGLTACQPTAPVTSNGDTVTNQASAQPAANDCGLTKGTLLDEKALFAAETAYNVPAHAYVTFDGTGKLPANVKAVAKPLLVQAYDALKLARTAYAAGDGCSLKRYSDLAVALGNKAKGILPK